MTEKFDREVVLSDIILYSLSINLQKKKKIIIELFSKYIVFDLMNSIEKDYNI